LAAQQPSVVAHLFAAGVDVANGGWGEHRGHAWTWANADVLRAAHAIRAATGMPVRTFVPGPRVDGFALASAAWEDQRVVLTRVVLDGTAMPALRAGGVYCFNSTALTPDQVLVILGQIQHDEALGLTVQPLSRMRD
jgi:hypothetical protein